MSKTGKNHIGNGKSFKVLKQDKKMWPPEGNLPVPDRKKSTKGKLEVSQIVFPLFSALLLTNWGK